MNSRFKLLKNGVGILVLTLFVSCQDTVPKRSLITAGSTANDPSSQCTTTQTFDAVTQKCKDKPIVRPSDAVNFKNDYCVCNNGKAVNYGNCGTFCSTKNTSGSDRLYANFTVTADVSLNTGLGSVYGWCKNLLAGDTINPKCQIEAKDDDGNKIMIDTALPAVNSNSITAEVQNLSYDKTYVLTLVETTSGARSNSIQIIKYTADTATNTLLGPLKNAPISQYTCIVRDTSTVANSSDVYYDAAYRLHFNFIPRIPPTPIPGGNSSTLFCHDIHTYGNVDDETYPRLELIPGVFNLWDTNDPRFYDNNGNKIMDVNELIVQKTKNFGGTIPSGVNFFNPFPVLSSPQLNSQAGNNTSTTGTTTAQPIGYIMAPWIDQTTFKSYCLTSTQYNSSVPLFKAFRDIIEVDTEGLYVGVKAPENITNGSTTTTGPSDYILIRETDLKQVWFYLNNGVPTAPTDANVANVAVYFYYPLNKTSPFVKSSSQRIFRVRGANELGSSQVSGAGADSGGATTSYPPHDRKIGCIPKF